MKSTEAGGDGLGGEGYDSDDSFIASSDEDMPDGEPYIVMEIT